MAKDQLKDLINICNRKCNRLENSLLKNTFPIQVDGVRKFHLSLVRKRVRMDLQEAPLYKYSILLFLVRSLTNLSKVVQQLGTHL